MDFDASGHGKDCPCRSTAASDTLHWPMLLAPGGKPTV
jgi:hypothetical protein